MRRSILTLYMIGSCPKAPLYDANAKPSVDRNRPPSLTECRLCEHYKGEEGNIVDCDLEKE